MVISERLLLAAEDAQHSDANWERWAGACALTRATHPLVRGTVSLGGGLIPLRNAAHLYRV